MTRKVAISVPEDLLAAVDQASEGSGISRSRFFGDAARARLTEARHRREVDAYVRSYRDDPENDDEVASTDAFLRQSFEDE